MKPCVECAFPLWCASVFIDGPLAFKLVESFGVLARSSCRLEVVCLQSLACPPGSLPRLEGCYYPPVVGPVSPRDKVMACIYIRHNVLFSNEPNITGPPNGYTCGVRVRVQGQLDFMIVNCYTPQPCTSFDWLTELGGKGRCLVTGDFNVRDSS